MGRESVRIAFLTEYFYPDSLGSTGTILSQLARRLADTHPDVSIDVVTSKHFLRGQAPTLPSYEEWSGIRINRLDGPVTKHDRTAVRLLRGVRYTAATFIQLLRNPGLDLVFAVTVPPLVPLAALVHKRLRAVPFVYLIHDLHPDVAVCLGAASPHGASTRIGAALQRRFLKAADRVIVLGRCMRKHLADRYDVPPEKVTVIPNWPDVGEAELPPPDETFFRRENELSGYLIVYAGHLGHCQRFDTILDAAATLRHARPDVTFCIVGGGPKEEEIRTVIAERDLGNVQLFPYVPRERFGDLLAAANLCLVSLEEGMTGLGVPSKTYNILAAGRPCFALVDGTSEVGLVLEEFGCGQVVAHGAPEELASAVVRLRDDPHLQAKMASGALRAAQHFSLENMVEEYASVFRSVVEAHNQPEGSR
jgi:glycosyltransferase involved in cell wall biosynthesis